MRPFICYYNPKIQCIHIDTSGMDTDRPCSHCENYSKDGVIATGGLPLLEEVDKIKLWFKNLFRSKKVKDLEELHSYMALYIMALEKDLKSAASIASIHHWKSDPDLVKAGIVYRKKIKELTEKIYVKS